MSFLKKRSFALCAAVGTACALALTALLALPVAWAIRSEVLPQSGGWICAAVCALLAVLAVTAAVARIRGRQAMALGGAVAGGYVTLAALACALGGAACAFGPWLGALAAAAAAGALAGSLLSLRRKGRRRRRR